MKFSFAAIGQQHIAREMLIVVGVLASIVCVRFFFRTTHTIGRASQLPAAWQSYDLTIRAFGLICTHKSKAHPFTGIK